MGVEPFLISSSLIAVIGQRLVRKVCLLCKKPYKPTPEVLESLGLAPGQKVNFVKGEGCQDCRLTGYAGRMGIYELLIANEELRNLIVTKASSRDLRAVAVKNGFVGIREEGLKAVLNGLTTPEEILRATQEIEV